MTTFPTITIYSTPTCHFCHKAKDFFTEHGVPFTDYDVVALPEKREEMLDLTGQLGVPVIVIGDEVLVGYDPARLSEKLGLGAEVKEAA